METGGRRPAQLGRVGEDNGRSSLDSEKMLHCSEMRGVVAAAAVAVAVVHSAMLQQKPETIVLQTSEFYQAVS